MSQSSTSRGAGTQVITPYIGVHDANAALEWYREHFGAAISNVIPWEGRVGHAELDDAVERVRAAAGTVMELNAWDVGREAICEDDQGVAFKLSEPAPGYDR